MKSYVFKIVVEQDEDRWFAYCPVLRKFGATTWGYTKEEAYKKILYLRNQKQKVR